MTPKEKAEELVSEFRTILMNEDTDCGNEILCTLIAQKHAHIVCDKIIELCNKEIDAGMKAEFIHNWYKWVKEEIDKICKTFFILHYLIK